MATLRTEIYVAAQRRRAAALNGTKGFALLKIEAGSIAIQEVVALRAEDVGHLEGGPSHSLFFRLNVRLMSGTLHKERLSSGLVTACKWRCDKCRY